jgi:hypothetical protein
MKPLYGFGDKRIEPVRVIPMPVSLGTPKNPILLVLRKLRAIGVQKYILRIDSKVVAGQIEK